MNMFKDNNKKKPKTTWQKIWYFIWDDDSIWSWIVNIIIAFVLIKFIIYPGIGLLLGTNYPVVAVVSGSMEHKAVRGVICGKMPEIYKEDFDNFWEVCGDYYSAYNINKENFSEYPFKNGFNTGDIIVLLGKKPKDIKVGDVIVFKGAIYNSKPDPIIHRVVDKKTVEEEYKEEYIFQTKGDHNAGAINGCESDGCIYESKITESQIIGKAVFRIPFLGYIKIWFVDFLRAVGLGSTLGKLF